MQKIILGIIVVLVIIGAGVAFLAFDSLKEPVSPINQDQNKPPKADEQDINEAFLEDLKTRHPEGETYVEAMIEARLLLEDEDKTNDLSALLDIGAYLNLLGEKELAVGWYMGALDIDPVNIRALNNLANIYDELGMFENSETVWLELIEVYPDNSQFYRSLGYLYRYRFHKSPEDIETFFIKGLKATNNDLDLLTWLIAYFQEIGDNERFAKYANLLNEQSQSQ